MGNNHSEQEQQSKGNPETKQESLPKKKDTDIWSSFRNKTKAPLSPPTAFKPVPPNLFKGIPHEFASAIGTSTFYTKQLLVETPHEDKRPVDSSPVVPAFSPQATLTTNPFRVPKEPRAYDISWDRPQVKSPVPTPISSFVFPSVSDNTPPKDPPKPYPPKSDPLKSDPPKPYPPKSDPPKSDPPKSYPLKSVPLKSDPPKSDPPKSVPLKSDPLKSIPLKSDPPKAVPPKAVPQNNSSEIRSLIPLKSDPPKSDTPKAVPQNIALASPTRPVAPLWENSPWQRKPPQIPKEAWPEPPPPVKPALTPETVIREAIASISQDVPVPFLFTATTPEMTQGPLRSEVAVVDNKTTSAEISEKSSSCSNNTVVNNTDSKSDDNVNSQTYFVISEETHAEIMSRLAYVENQKWLPEPPVTQKQAVVQRALNGVSYAEAVKKSQPKVNPARREARAKLLKKIRLSKYGVKQTETQTDDDSAEGGNTVPQQPCDNSSTHLLPLKGAPDQSVTPKNKAATEQTTHLNQNEKSAISSNLIELEKEPPLANATKKIEQKTDNAPSKNTKPEPNLNQNPPTLPKSNQSVRGTNPTLRTDTSKTVFCQAHNVNTAPAIDLTDEAQMREILNAIRVSPSPSQISQSELKAALQAASVSLLHDKVKQTKLRVSAQISRAVRGKVKESFQCVPSQVDPKSGPKKAPLPTDTPQEHLDCSAANVVHSELSSSTGPSKESQKPLITPHQPALSPVSPDPSLTSTSPNCLSTTDILNARCDKQGAATTKATPAIELGQSPSKFITRAHQTHAKIPANANQVQTKMKEIKQLPPKSKMTEKEDTNIENEEKAQDPKPSTPSPQPLSRPEGRWHPFTTDRSCVQRVRCQHRENGKLPKNVVQWLNVSRNYLCEPSWVTTASLAASIALSVRLDREDSRQ
ncbi:titin-like [Alosa alosa]|uniref:titin-like n=1 Tax=Alosa alosa TaxID=278164 RepID=UPI0020151344|nr:titin-like [Alosa alosa]